MCGTYDCEEFFSDIRELNAIDQKVIPYVLREISISGLKPNGSVPTINNIRIRGYSLNALE